MTLHNIPCHYIPLPQITICYVFSRSELENHHWPTASRDMFQPPRSLVLRRFVEILSGTKTKIHVDLSRNAGFTQHSKSGALNGERSRFLEFE